MNIQTVIAGMSVDAIYVDGKAALLIRGKTADQDEIVEVPEGTIYDEVADEVWKVSAGGNWRRVSTRPATDEVSATARRQREHLIRASH